MRIAIPRRAWLCLAALWLAGCSVSRPYRPLDLPPSARLVEVSAADRGSTDPDAGVRPAAYRPRNVLVLSGGGQNGAYTVGVLNGWTAAGTRPTFDVVTGISTGALIAPFAFLGPAYDEALAKGYTEVQAGDILSRRPVLSLLFADSLAESKPLRRRIAAAVTPEVLAAVARGHAQGRRLYVGTTDLDDKRLVVWDMGAIAAGNDPNKLELFRNVLLASASYPGVLPPVTINVQVDGRRYSELHVDGGVTASLFLQPVMLGLNPNRTDADGDEATVYVIVAGKLRPVPKPVLRQLLVVAEDSVSGILQSRFEGDLLKTYLLARFAGARFALTAVPEDFPEPADSLAFDQSAMQALFAQGYRSGRGGDWLSLPPTLTPGEHPPPRQGIIFTVQEAPAATIGTPAEAGHERPGAAVSTLLDRVREDMRRAAQSTPKASEPPGAP